MAHAHFDYYASPAVASTIGNEVVINIGDILSDPSAIRLALTRDEAIKLAADLTVAAAKVPA